MQLSRMFSDFAAAVSRATGRPVTFALCVATIVVWEITGPFFHYSDTWQLVINTGTTIVTFLQVFLIQNTQNRDGAALQTKLDELIRTSHAHNRYIGIEHLTEEELEELRSRCETRARAAKLSEAEKAGDQAKADVNARAAKAAKEAVE